MATYSTVRDTEQSEEHVLVAARGDFAHHRLRVGIIRCLEQTEQDVVDPEIVHVMVAHPVGPQTQHSIERYEHRKGVGDHKHGLGSDTKVLLDVPKAESACDGAGSLGEAEVGYLEEGEGDNVILDNGDERSGCV